MKLKLATWNLEWFGQLLQNKTRTLPAQSKAVTSAAGKAVQEMERAQIAAEIRAIDADILCVQEGPSTGKVSLLKDFCATHLNGTYTVIERGPTDDTGYQVRGAQGIWFLVKTGRLSFLSPTLLPIPSWRAATEFESRPGPGLPGEHGKKWPIIHPWFKPTDSPPEEEGHEGEGDAPIELADREHSHFRHPQTLVCTINGKRVDFIGVHLKSKFSKSDYEKAGKARQKPKDQLTQADKKVIREVEEKAVEARIKLTTECVDIRHYIDNRFRNEPYPAIVLLGDMNDGIGKEFFERRYLFHDLLANLQGEVFFARRFLNHALFDYMIDAGENYRWTVEFEDAWDPGRDPRILIDHIMFTQSMVGADAFAKSGLRVGAGAGQVEHAVHVAANTPFSGAERGTSDHRPVSVVIDVEEAIT